MNKQEFIDETLMQTPKPRASSTVRKPQTANQIVLNPILLNYSSNTTENSLNSLGVLNTEELNSYLNNTERQSCGNEKLIQQRILSNSLLHKTKNFGLPSRYLKESHSIKSSTSSSGSDSTVNETDLLNSQKTERVNSSTLNFDTPVKEEKSTRKSNDQEKLSFKPDDISTPRNSSVGLQNTSREKLSFNPQISQSLIELSKQLNVSDLSLTELCEQFCKNIDVNISKDDDSFVPGELAQEKFAEQEKLWQKQYGILGEKSIRNDSVLSQLDPNNLINNDERMSVSAFFRKKSELAELCLKNSPHKKKPQPLIDVSSLDSFAKTSTAANADPIRESLFSVSEIQKVISVNDNTARIMDYMFAKSNKGQKQSVMQDVGSSKQKSEFKENQTPYNSLEGSFEYTTTNSTERDTLKDSQQDKSLNSVRTVSSLDSLPNGKLPIECNRTELTWGCIKIGEKQTQSFILRNRSHNKLRLQISSSNSNFKILNDHSEADPTLILPVLLYPSESRAFSIMFTPTCLGAFVDKLKFSPISRELQLQQTKRQQLMLYGYGGSSNVEIEDISKDPNLKMWLSLGKLNNAYQVSKSFSICNLGNLSAFCCLNYKSKALFSSSKVTLYPNEVVLKPKERLKINVVYVLTKDDTKRMFASSNSQVIEMGVIHIITGEEILRGRIRRLCEKLKQSGGVIGNSLIEKLSKKFADEDIPKDICKFTESVATMKELMQKIVSKEIILTIEKDLECPLIGQIAGIDDTSIFYSLNESMPTILSTKTLTNACVVEPTSLILKPPIKSTDFVMMTNHSYVELEYKISVTPEKMLEVTPLEGKIAAGDTLTINIACNTKFQEQQIFKILINIDGDDYEVTVKIVPGGSFKTK